jgi:hypothetical protein
MSYMPDLSNISSVYPSPERDDEEEESQSGKTSKPAAKRKRENRYKNAPPAVLSVGPDLPLLHMCKGRVAANVIQRRRAQNRASQRAYRERKDQRIKDLETMLNEAKQRNDVLGQAYATLHAEYVQLRTSQLKEQQLEQSHAAYGSSGAGLLFDPNMGAMTSTNADRLDMDLYVYTDLTNGANSFSL